MNRKII